MIKNNKATIVIKSILPKSGEKVNFYMLANAVGIKSIPRAALKDEMKKRIKEVQLDSPVSFKSTNVTYSIEEEIEGLEFGNSIVEVNLPYCLHLPNGVELDITIAEKNIHAKVSCFKIWTKKAEESSLTDFYTDDKLTYFNKGNVVTPKMPYDEKMGWAPEFTGKNMELTNGAGYFRFTKLRISLTTDYGAADFGKDDSTERIITELNSLVLQIINRIIDVYRYITKKEYIERLSYAIVTNIYFYDCNKGIYPIGMPIEGATMNRSRNEIDDVVNFLKEDSRPPMYELFFLDAKSALVKKRYALSVMVSFQGLEIFIDNFISKKLSQQGLSEKEIMSELKRNWRTKDKIRDTLPRISGHSLRDENKNLWDRWSTCYDKVRNEVIHQGREVSESETTRTINLNEEIVGWIKTIT